MPTSLHNFTQIDLTDMKIFPKVFGGGATFLNYPVRTNVYTKTRRTKTDGPTGMGEERRPLSAATELRCRCEEEVLSRWLLGDMASSNSELLPCDSFVANIRMKKSPFSTLSRFISEMTRDSHSYCGALTGIRTQSVDYCHFQ